jgi:multiple sugar transport system ATP-binding protein
MRCGLRPEHLGIDMSGAGVAAEVVHAEHLGDASILHLRVDGVEALQTAKVAAGRERAATGQRVGLVPDAAWTLGFDRDGRSVG